MKTVLTIVLLLFAMMVVKTSNANSQDACTKSYVGCMDGCVAKRAGQERCIEVCQQRNDQCAANIYATPAEEPVSTARPKESGEAMDARDENSADAEKPAAKARTKAPASATAKAPQSRRQDVR